MPSLAGNSIVIPLLNEYYLFDYFSLLVRTLLDKGFSVDVVTFDASVLSRYATIDPRIKVVRGFGPVGLLLPRTGRGIFNAALWGFAWIWAALLKRRYDFAIVPADNTPVWYAICRIMPALTCHTTTEYIDIASTIKRDSLRKPLAFGHVLLDKVSGKRWLPRVNGVVVRFPRSLLVDRLMGFRGRNYYMGCSGKAIVTVTGPRIKENLAAFGVGAGRVRVVGNPNYDFLPGLVASFDDHQRRLFLQELGVRQTGSIFSLFLSPSSFSEIQIREVMDVLRTVYATVPEACCVVKFHPKTRSESLDRFREELLPRGDRARLLTGFSGDEFNARLMLVSKAVIQKQSTLGFLAMRLRRPVISYHLFETAYEDDMYEIIGGNVRARTTEELAGFLKRLDDPAFTAAMERSQQEACSRFCVETVSCGEEIASIVGASLTEGRR
ncbi:MAG TPA: hypothetical protein P5110_07325 [Candidatus Omnitrophota bacterium]|nr:hypothetical protein [Candidatus Omnitrophota bacterium]HRZ15300.1 hypothetical protein [Candidatus Omnitrophota bacterium]